MLEILFSFSDLFLNSDTAISFSKTPMTDTRYINTGRAYARAIIKFIKDDEDDLSSINL